MYYWQMLSTDLQCMPRGHVARSHDEGHESLYQVCLGVMPLQGTEDVTYNEKKLRQQQWKAEQKELQAKRRGRHARETGTTAHACGDRTQFLMRLLPDQGISDGQCGERLLTQRISDTSMLGPNSQSYPLDSS